MIEMIYELPNIFRPHRPDQADWILFDATAPISEEEEKYLLEPVSVPRSIKSEILKLLMANDLGVFIDDIPHAYYVSILKSVYW